MFENGGRPATDQRCATAAVFAANPRAVNSDGRADVALNSGHAISHVQRSRAGIENQRRIQHVGFAIDRPGMRFGHSQQRNQQREGNSQSYQNQQGSSAGRPLLFYSCF